MTRLSTIALALITTLVVSQPIAAQPEPPEPPAPPSAPRPPRPPRPPIPPRVHGKVKIQLPPDVRAEVEAEMQRARADIDRALAEIDANSQIPPAIKIKIKNKLTKLRNADLDELIAMAGDMDEFGREMQKWGEKLGEDVQRDVEKAMKDGNWQGQDFNFDFDTNDDGSDDQDDSDTNDDNSGDPWAGTAQDQWGPGPMTGPHGRGSHAPSQPSVIDMGDDFALDVDIDALQLSAPQRVELKRIHIAEKAAVAPAQRKIGDLSRELRGELESDDTSDAEINRLVDEISQQESVVRKARLQSLVKTRKLLSTAQRSKVDGRTR